MLVARNRFGGLAYLSVDEVEATWPGFSTDSINQMNFKQKVSVDVMVASTGGEV